MSVKSTVEFVINHFKTNPRSMNPNYDVSSPRCLYKGPNGERCAFAICCNPKVELQENVPAYTILSYKGFDILLPEFAIKNSHFWSDIQYLHDCDDFWTPNDLGGNDLTEDGLIQVKTILSKYGETNANG